MTGAKAIVLGATVAVGLAVAATASGAAKPSPPSIAGPDATASGKHAYVFSSVEKGVRQSRLRYRCSLDSTTLHPCRARVTFTLAAGTHLVRAQALDPAGHKSTVSRLRVVVQAVAPALAVTKLWQTAVTTKSLPQGAAFGSALGPDGNLYVSDSGDDQVKVYDPSGHLLRTWASPGSAPGQFRFEFDPDQADKDIPFSSLGVDGHTGQVYVAEAQRVQRFDAGGGFQLGWGSEGIGNGQFMRIADLVVGPSGTVYALEDRPKGLGRVQEFDANGGFLTTFGRTQILDSGGLTLDSRGDVIVADDDANNLKIFSPEGKLLRVIGQSGDAPGSLAFPTEMAVAGDTLYVSDTNHDRIVRFDLATGKPTGYWPVEGNPDAIEVDGSGDAYVVSDAGALTKYRLP